VTPDLSIITEKLPREDWGEAWFCLQRCIKGYKSAMGPFERYFARAWKCACVDKLRRSSPRVRNLRDRSRRVQVLSMLPDYDYPAPPERTPERIEWEIPTLSALHARDTEYKAIAEILNIPIGTMKSRLHDERKKLRKRLEAA